jgi:rfaE bifunctional protein nucleotidyltransferase chain/domain
MKKILTTEQAITVSNELQKQGKNLVLTGGCFDILHIGHIRFLEHAKTKGDVLFVMLEHDVTIKKRKGEHRPLNKQADRAEILAALAMIDYVIALPEKTDDTFYDDLVNQIKPAIIATTVGDPYRTHKERQAKRIGAKVVDVIQPVTNKSTTKVISILREL